MGPQQLRLLLKPLEKILGGRRCFSCHASRASSGSRDSGSASVLSRRPGSTATRKPCTRVASGFASRTIVHDVDSPVNSKNCSAAGAGFGRGFQLLSRLVPEGNVRGLAFFSRVLPGSNICADFNFAEPLTRELYYHKPDRAGSLRRA